MIETYIALIAFSAFFVHMAHRFFSLNEGE